MFNSTTLHEREKQFDRFVRDGAHPCAMARAVMSNGSARFGIYGRLGTRAAASAVCRDLVESLAKPPAAGLPWSFVAFFEDCAFGDERSFENALWAQLQAMHDIDSMRFDWDASVNADPEDPGFSFSIGGRAWYVIGLHPASSRKARRFDGVALVFNPHVQFEQLRAAGKYETVKNRIRQRDVALQGTVNPMLADHGQSSEARQYSGRALEAGWKCPFSPRTH